MFYKQNNTYILVLALCFMSFYAQAQNYEQDYTLLKSQAPIPESILTSSEYKSEQLLETETEEVDDKRSKRKQNNKESFIVETNYVLDQLLKSDLLLFNTPLNKMVEQVADVIIQANGLDQSHFSFYVVKTSAVNAFATDRGDIFITMGLLARIKNEAELAFILAHELVHSVEEHSMDLFLEFEELNDAKNEKLRESVNVLLEKSNYSKKIELEADAKGLAYFSKTNYNYKVVDRVFDMLSHTHTAVFNDSISKEDFEFKYIKIEADAWVDTTKQIKALEDNSIYSTHPASQERLAHAKDELIGYERLGNASYITQKEAEFQALVTMANFELVEILLHQQEYSAALYQVICLQKRFPDNAYLKKSFAYAWYVFGQYALLENDDIIARKTAQGYWGKLDHLFDEIPRRKVAVLAAAYAWEAHKAFPEDERTRLMAKDHLEDIGIFDVEDPLDYFIKARHDSLLTIDEVPSARLAFTPYLDDTTFVAHLKAGQEYRTKFDARKKLTYKERKAKERKERNSGKAVGAESVVVINPLYLRAKVVKRELQFDFISSESGQNLLSEYIAETADELDYDYDIVDVNALQSEQDIEALNDIHTVQWWIDEFTAHPDYILTTNHNEAIAVCDKYDTDHFANFGVIALRSRTANRGLWAALLYSRGLLLVPILSPAGFPIFGYLVFRKSNETYYFMNAYNVRKYKYELSDFNRMNIKEQAEVIKSHLYWSFSQLKRKK